jgi:hypothetical protein
MLIFAKPQKPIWIVSVYRTNSAQGNVVYGSLDLEQEIQIQIQMHKATWSSYNRTWFIGP